MNLPSDNSRISVKSLSFNDGPGKQGDVTIYFLDGVPVFLNWYEWDLDDDWMISQIEKELNSKIKLSNLSGGNGRFSADLELIK